MRIVVIGSGLIGTSVAYECAKAGAEVTVLESGRISGGTSAVSFAWTNATGKSPRSYFDLNVAGMRAHLELKRDFPSAPWFVQTGSFEWRTTDAGAQALLDHARQLEQWGYGIDWLDGRHVVEREPDVDIAAIGDRPVAFFHEEGWVDPVLYAGWLLRAASERWQAVVVPNARVVAVEPRAGGGLAVRTASGDRVEADAVVNCSGPGAAAALGAAPAIPMASTVGVLAFTPPMALTLRSMLHVDDLDIRSDGAGRLMLHKVSVDAQLTGAVSSSPDGPEAESLLGAAALVLPALRGTAIEAIRTTMRPIPGDGLTCAGQLPQLAGYYVAVTHSGATIAPFLGKAMADEIVRGRPSEKLNDFRPDRFFARAAATAGPAARTLAKA